MTTVTNLSTGETLIYSLLPEQAVIAAFESSKGNNNTWTYKDSKAQVTRGKHTVACGDFCARNDVTGLKL